MIRSSTPVSVAEEEWEAGVGTCGREVKVLLAAWQTGVATRGEVSAGWRTVNDPENQFLSVIQIAITPVILISGIGALMLTLTNRLGRIVDRTRALAGQMHGANGPDRA